MRDTERKPVLPPADYPAGSTGMLGEDCWCRATVTAYVAEEVAKERERLLSLARSRADYEATNAAHHAGTWYAAYERHMIRSSAMRELINAISTAP